MICPACSYNNDNDEKTCTLCGMLLLHNDIISLNDISRYKEKLKQTSNKNEDSFFVENGTLIRYNGLNSLVVIPPTVLVLGDHCFTKSPKDIVEEVRIHSKVQTINSFSIRNSKIPSNDGAFEMCQSLKRIIIENGSELYEIGRYAFFNCKNLEVISGLPTHEVFVGRHSFHGCRKDIIKMVSKHKNYIFEEGWNE